MFRNIVRLTHKGPKLTQSFTQRFVSFKPNKSQNVVGFGILGLSLTVGTGIYIYNRESQVKESMRSAGLLLASQCAESTNGPQDNVISQPRQHALYLTIHLKPEAHPRDVLRVVGQINAYIDSISPVDLRDESDEIIAGVGFGPNFLAKARPVGQTSLNYSYHSRKGSHGTMPSTGGDLFIHAKSNEYSKVFELAHKIIKELGANGGKNSGGLIESYEDIYGWVYRGGRDLSGFIDGTENPADDEHRTSVAVNPVTGGSFAITQKWIHKHNVISNEKESNLESFVGRKISDSTELRKKAVTSHVARMTGGSNFEQKKVHEIVRQSQPFGTLSGENGLFFIAYAKDPTALDYMLDRMVGNDRDWLSDDIMRLSSCVKSTYWYFPSKQELKKIVSSY